MTFARRSCEGSASMARPRHVSPARARRAASAVAVAALALAPRAAAADPQIAVGASPGLAVRDLRTTGPELAFTLAGRADAIFFRSRSSDMGLGPYVDVGTTAFDTLQAGGGATWVVPAFGTAFALSGGALAHSAPGGVTPSAEASLFWGSRSYNFHSVYGATTGLVLTGRYGLGAGTQADVGLALRLDLAHLALPFVLLVNAFR